MRQGQWLTLCVFLQVFSPSLLSQGLLLDQGLDVLAKLAAQTALSLLSRHADAGDPNSGPHACMTTTLPTEFSSSSKEIILRQDLKIIINNLKEIILRHDPWVVQGALELPSLLLPMLGLPECTFAVVIGFCSAGIEPKGFACKTSIVSIELYNSSCFLTSVNPAFRAEYFEFDNILILR